MNDMENNFEETNYYDDNTEQLTAPEPTVQYTESDIKNDSFANAEIQYDTEDTEYVKDAGKTLSILSICLAGAGFILNCGCTKSLALPLAIAGLIIGIVGMKKKTTIKALNIIGIILGALVLLLFVVGIVLSILGVAANVTTSFIPLIIDIIENM